MSGSGDIYLIWSHEHGAWWRPGKQGYTPSTLAAGRYRRDEALAICADAIPGTAARFGALPELPVRLADIDAVRGLYRDEYPDLPPEAWE